MQQRAAAFTQLMDSLPVSSEPTECGIGSLAMNLRNWKWPATSVLPTVTSGADATLTNSPKVRPSAIHRMAARARIAVQLIAPVRPGVARMFLRFSSVFAYGNYGCLACSHSDLGCDRDR
jgi:hypothetical protein